MVSTSSFKNLEKSEKCHFEMLIKSVFELKVASKTFPKMSPMTNFGFTDLNALPRFSNKRFQPCHQKTCKKVKNVICKCLEHSCLTSR